MAADQRRRRHRAGGAPPSRRRAARLPLWPLAACATLAAVLVVVAGCGHYRPSLFLPESPQARHIVNTAYLVFAILSLVLLTVWALLAIVLVRSRRVPDDEVPQTAGNTTLEIVWTVIPALIVIFLMVLTVRATGAVSRAGGSVEYTATGRQWWWDVTYPQQGFRTANEIHVPVDRTVTATLLSADVIHSYWVPQMGGKVDMIPGHINHVTFTPVTLGSFLGQCSEFCGHAHAQMRFLVFVDTPAQFAAWVADQRRPAATPVGPDATAGAQLIGTLACGGCHTIRGSALNGTYGPDLTHVGSRTTLGAVTIANTPPNLSAWITDSTTIKAGSLMPPFPLAPQQLAQLVAYLEGLK